VTKTVNAKVGICQVDDYTRWLLDIGFGTENTTRWCYKVLLMTEGELLSRFTSVFTDLIRSLRANKNVRGG